MKIKILAALPPIAFMGIVKNLYFPPVKPEDMFMLVIPVKLVLAKAGNGNPENAAVVLESWIPHQACPPT